jgi:hypothetical protein
MVMGRLTEATLKTFEHSALTVDMVERGPPDERSIAEDPVIPTVFIRACLDD